MCVLPMVFPISHLIGSFDLYKSIFLKKSVCKVNLYTNVHNRTFFCRFYSKEEVAKMSVTAEWMSTV